MEESRGTNAVAAGALLFISRCTRRREPLIAALRCVIDLVLIRARPIMLGIERPFAKHLSGMPQPRASSIRKICGPLRRLMSLRSVSKRCVRGSNSKARKASRMRSSSAASAMRRPIDATAV